MPQNGARRNSLVTATTWEALAAAMRPSCKCVKRRATSNIGALCVFPTDGWTSSSLTAPRHTDGHPIQHVNEFGPRPWNSKPEAVNNVDFTHGLHNLLFHRCGVETSWANPTRSMQPPATFQEFSDLGRTACRRSTMIG